MKFFILLILGIAVSFLDGKAQWGNDACPIPGDTVACPWRPIVNNHRIQLSHSHDQYADVTYRFRYCNGVLEFDILGVSLLDNTGHFQEFDKYHYEYSTLRSVLEFGLITEFENDTNIRYFPPHSGSPNPSCRDTVTWANFYMASCGIFLGCHYRLTDTNVVCDSGFVSPFPEIVRIDSFPSPKFPDGWYVNFQMWQKCGEQCCKRTYKICRDMSEVPSVSEGGAGSIPMLRIISTNVVSNGECSEQSKFCENCYNNCWNMP
jgi:hypothetical protein